MAESKYSREQLMRAVELSESFTDVGRNLGVANPSYAASYIKSRLARENIDVSHFKTCKRKYTYELLSAAAEEANSFSQTNKNLGLSPNGGNIDYIKKKLIQFGIDTSHFLGQAHNRGTEGTRKRTADEILIQKMGSCKETSKVLRRALFEIGRKEECRICKQGPEWNGKFLRLHVDHINGDNMDNRRENLRFLCPHCHSQTANFGIKNSQVYKDGLQKKAERKAKNLTRKGRKKESPIEKQIRLEAKEKFKVSPEELRRLVWEKPTVEIAAMFGVSDNAIGRRCKKYGIQKPPRGYWQKKQAGMVELLDTAGLSPAARKGV